DTYVAYGLGNFVWYTNGSEAASTTGVLTLTLDSGTVVGERWAPARIQDDGIPRFSSGAEAETAVATFAERRACTDLVAL
ncbi:MAG: CapA family protein, partial [Jiangellaceae bacterium]